MKRRVLAAALACLLLCGCGPAAPAVTEVPPPEGTPVAYVPLDDRPDNVERVVYLASSVGFDLRMPEADHYRTRLNGQPLNENGTQYGNRAALYEWVLAQEASGCDRYILSVDQLLSGGLVNSRAMTAHEDVPLSDGSVLTEQALLEELLATLTADGNNRVWLLDSVMRLAPTVGYQNWTLEEYNALRSYGAQPRPTLTAAEVSAVEMAYRLGEDGQPLKPEEYGLEAWELEQYLAARSRKLALSDEMLRLRTADTVHVLLGIDDSSEANSIQKPETDYLRTLLQPGDALLSGVDDLAFKAVTRLYLEEIDWQGASVWVDYCGGTEDRPACAYDAQPLEEIVAEHFDFFGLRPAASPAESDFRVVVLTQPLEAEKKADYCRQAVKFLQQNQKEQALTVLIDAGNGQYGTQFQELLTKETELGALISYAGFLDMAIVTGTALSHGVARYAWLTHESEEAILGTNAAFAETLLDSVVKDFCFKHVVREQLLTYLRGDLGANPDNFWNPKADMAPILDFLEQGMAEATAPVLKNFSRSNLWISTAGDAAGWGSVSTGNYTFPWDRAFEITMDMDIGPFTEAHKTVLGIVVR